MKYRLVALDLDGTLLDSQQQIRSATIDALRQVRAKGVQVMIVTGRHHVTAYPFWHQLELESPAICCNGTYLYDFGARRPLANTPITKQEAHQLLALVRKHEIYTMMYVDHFMAFESESFYYPHLLKWAESLPPALRPRIECVPSYDRLADEVGAIWKFASAGDDYPAMCAFAEEIEQTIGLSCEWSGTRHLDIAHGGNNKGNRLAEWIAEQGIPREQVIAFGDQQNDREMLRVAGMGVAMGNSSPEVQACANWVIGCNDSDAIAETLRRLVLEVE